MQDKIIQIEIKQEPGRKEVGLIALSENGNIYKFVSGAWELIISSPTKDDIHKGAK